MLAAVGVGGAAISPVYPLVLVLVLLGGLGVAAFHPEGSKFAAYASGRKRASGMSYFNTGGNAGYALGAFVTGQLVVWLGLVGGLVAMVPVFVASLALMRVIPRLSLLAPETQGPGMKRGDDRRRAMALLGIVISLRSVAWFTLLAFVPLWVVSLGHSKAEGNRLLFVMLLVGGGGDAHPRPGRGPDRPADDARRHAGAPTPLILAFVYVGGALGVVALMLVGVCVVGTFGVTMVLSQLYLPRHVGMASGLSVGLAMGIGGLAAVASGAIADAVGLQTALTISALAPALGVVFCLRLPAPSARAEAQTAAGGRTFDRLSGSAAVRGLRPAPRVRTGCPRSP